MSIDLSDSINELHYYIGTIFLLTNEMKTNLDSHKQNAYDWSRSILFKKTLDRMVKIKEGLGI